MIHLVLDLVILLALYSKKNKTPYTLELIFNNNVKIVDNWLVNVTVDMFMANLNLRLRQNIALYNQPECLINLCRCPRYAGKELQQTFLCHGFQCCARMCWNLFILVFCDV